MTTDDHESSRRAGANLACSFERTGALWRRTPHVPQPHATTDRSYSRATEIEGFQIVRRLGKGGMGEVFEAVRTGPGGFRRAVALKRLYGDDAMRGASVERFLAEARILAGLHHPNIVEVHDVVASPGGYVLVMELLTGATLRDLAAAARDGRIAAEDACAIADRALAGLAYVHAARDEHGRELGLVHRDVTPNNVFVTTAGEVKLLDFGIAKLRAAIDAPLTRDGEVRGTLELIAPEQARGEPVDPRTDLYLLAGSLYWALTGSYPHGTGATTELLVRAANDPVAPLARVRPDLPAALRDAIDRAMAMSPADRFASATDMRTALAPLVPANADQRLAALVASIPARTEPTPTTEASIAEPTSPPTVRETPQAREKSKPPEVAPTPAPRDQPRRTRWALLAIPIVIAGAGIVAWRVRASGDAPAAAGGTGSAGSAKPIAGGLVAVDGASGAVSATPASGGRIAYAIDNRVVIVAATGAKREVQLAARLVALEVRWLGGDKFSALCQRDDGSYELDVIDDSGAHQLRYVGGDHVLAAVHPDGVQFVKADSFGVWLYRPNEKDLRLGRSLETGDAIIGLAWSPDGSRVAVAHAPPHEDAHIDLIDPAGGETKVLAINYRYGVISTELAVFGWLDAKRIAYAMPGFRSAVVTVIDTDTRMSTDILTLPNEAITGGGVGDGRIALVHGPIRHGLLLGTRAGLAAAKGGATAIAGFDGGAAPIVEHAADQPFGTRRGDGTFVPWPFALAGDRPLTLAGSAVLAVRGNAVWRLPGVSLASARKVVMDVAPRGTTAVRCAGDVAPPCVLANGDERIVHYLALDPDTGKHERVIGELGIGVDHAVSPDGAWLAVARGTRSLRVFDIADETDTKDRWIDLSGGGTVDGVAWADAQTVVVSARHWKQQPWALLAIGPDRNVTQLATGRDTIAAEVRMRGDAIGVATTDVTPALSLLEVP